MRFVALLIASCFSRALSFTPSSSSKAPRCFLGSTTFYPSGALQASSGSDEERMKKIMEEEAMNAANLKASAEAMKAMKPEDVDKMIAEMDSMPKAQLDQLKSMGMDPGMMKETMRMMKDNPSMLQDMGEIMESMTPEELIAQSKLAQENMKNLAATSGGAASAPAATDAEIVNIDDEDDDEEEEEEEDEEEEDSEPVEPVPEVLDAMYRVAELMSSPPDEGGVTFPAFATVPPVAVLSGKGDDDLSRKELTECWNKGSLGATRVDRAGFERVWREVQDNYYDDIVEEARERMLIRKKKKRGLDKPATTSVAPTTPLVGSNVPPELLQEQVKSMKDEDLTAMFDRMNNMSPAEEERMKAMGVDPAMMKKSAAMMKDNPLLRKAATMMIKNTPPEQLVKASQQAQERMANMSDEEKKRILDNLKKGASS